MDIYNIENISAGYGDHLILKGIDISVSEGDFISIIGPNGAGKSTFIKILSGDIKPVKGRVLFQRIPLVNYKKFELARELSIVHQFTENILPFTVYEFLRMGRFPHQKIWEIETDNDRDIINNALEIMDIIDLRDRLLTELSGGEMQLAYIAKALVQNRKVIILDEPVSHLDVKHSIQIMDILFNLNKQGSTIITVLHDINISSDYCNRIIGLKNGKIFFDGSPEDVMKYDLIEELFDIVCIVSENPISGKPIAYSVPEYVSKQAEKK